jgi:hypothetical protein
VSIERTPISEFRKATLNAQWPSDTEIARLNLRPNTIVFRNLETGEQDLSAWVRNNMKGKGE